LGDGRGASARARDGEGACRAAGQKVTVDAALVGRVETLLGCVRSPCRLARRAGGRGYEKVRVAVAPEGGAGAEARDAGSDARSLVGDGEADGAAGARRAELPGFGRDMFRIRIAAGRCERDERECRPALRFAGCAV